MTHKNLSHESCERTNFSNAPPVILISRYRRPGMRAGSASAAFDCRAAGPARRSAARFSACLRSSVLFPGVSAVNFSS